MTAAPFMAPLFAGLFFARALPTLAPTTIPVGASLLAMALCQATWIFESVHIQCCGNGRLGFRPYGGSLGKAPSNQGLLPLSFGASLRLGMPSLRSCSVGPPPSAIHGRGRLTRHPCRVAHCAEPPLGLTRGRTPQQRPRRPTGRPVCWVRSAVMYLVDWQVAIASKLAPTGIEYICKISVGWQAVFASRLAPTVDPGRSARDWSAGRPPSRASPLPQGLGTSAKTKSAVRPPSRASSLPQKSRAKAGPRRPTLFTTHQAER
ncbi:hypothetical protein PS647_04198 [Pseudomonas fluorescens]|jgi:hypothetical protein|nr:hypothetical protein PS647_04198 [Pseudomonas fluorescens]